jgi:Putative citrate transport
VALLAITWASSRLTCCSVRNRHFE